MKALSIVISVCTQRGIQDLPMKGLACAQAVNSAPAIRPCVRKQIGQHAIPLLTMASKRMPRMSFDEAKQWVREQRICSYKEWNQVPVGKLHPMLPRHPDRFYSNEWLGWGDFFGTGRVFNVQKSKRFVSFTKAREWARSQKITPFQEWRLVSKRGLPPNVPACPHSTYRNEWQGWGDFLGTFRPPTSAVPMLPYSDAKAWARSEQIRSLKEWVSRRKLGLPRGIPTNPNRSYRALWQGWPAFLGTEAERGRRKQNWGILRGSS
jgi:hypothetical protein